MSDILVHNLNVYNSKCDDLIRKLDGILSREDLYEMFDWIDNFSATKKEIEDFEKLVEKKYLELIKK